jgi:hypothetical protein
MKILRERSHEEYLDDGDRKERLDVPEQMIGGDAGVVGPRREGAEEAAEHHA